MPSAGLPPSQGKTQTGRAERAEVKYYGTLARARFLQPARRLWPAPTGQAWQAKATQSSDGVEPDGCWTVPPGTLRMPWTPR